MSGGHHKKWNSKLNAENCVDEPLGQLRWQFKSKVADFDPLNIYEITDYFGRWGVSRTLFLSTVFLALTGILVLEISDSVGASLLWLLFWLVGTAPVWLPIASIIGAYYAWVWYVRSLFLAGRDPVLLEIKMPREIMKSPRAMEIALTNFWISSGEVTFIHRFWRGSVRPWFAFEIASFGGDVHFYVWTWRAYKNTVEMSLYGQYPEVEIYETEDYASKFVYDPKIHKCFATDYRLEDLTGALPIKTYIEYELDKDPKEELKVEPLGQVLEVLSGIKKTEQAWIQINIRQAGKNGVLLRTPEGTDTTWQKAIIKTIEDIRKRATMWPGEKYDPKIAPTRFPHVTWKQTQQIQSMERHSGKYPFDVVMRGVYIADTTKGPFDGSTFVNVRWIWRPFNSPGFLNSLIPKGWHNETIDYPWQDWKDMRWKLHTRRFFDAYRRRSSFYIPWDTIQFVMTTEAIASIWHPPSRIIAAPGLSRIPSTKAEPPPNLPT